MPTPEKRRAKCRCGADFGYNWVAYAQHVIQKLAENKRDPVHRGSRLFAHKILTNAKRLNQKRDLKPRVPLTSEQRATLKSLFREVSGEKIKGVATCPQCKKHHTTEVDAEYIQEDGEMAWRNVKGELMIFCNGCRTHAKNETAEP